MMILMIELRLLGSLIVMAVWFIFISSKESGYKGKVDRTPFESERKGIRKTKKV